ncbi:2-dehydro-3-deoxygluconokinase [Hartmannibacter diazotrophicus]|uniref:2-dehydro-3-deoxygluconokinase n=1 Tax=Hartmannibacter diazotrophicus TaxID=1482074 RepID=A0A2C9DE79_9HYPH|nr:sugar kinase [Hartmannibacter diazotrophicus]SON58141.1 2-dehydro-3-deoxygluconokinase [Hartmannibacter diazotrophicus]
MPRIVTAGECMVEMSPLAEPGTFRMGYAGDSFNTGWYLRHCLPAEWQVDYLTAVGTDAVSDEMLAFMAASGVGTDHVARRADKTVGLYLIELAGGERSFSYWRGDSAARTFAREAGWLRSAFADADCVLISGITLAILIPEDRERLLAALSDYRQTGGCVAFDPNLRPRLWASEREMTEWIERAAAVSDLVLPSYEDEARWFADRDPEATAARYAGLGASLVVVKDGGKDVLVRSGEKTSWCVVEPVADVVDTTAAGDSFNAGFLAAWLQGSDLDVSVRSGTALAAQVIGQRGALVPVDIARVVTG